MYSESHPGKIKLKKKAFFISHLSHTHIYIMYITYFCLHIKKKEPKPSNFKYCLSPVFSSKNSTKHSGFTPCLGNFPELLSFTSEFQSCLVTHLFVTHLFPSCLTFGQTTKPVAMRDSSQKLCCSAGKILIRLPQNPEK